jgi:hypothetical protein
MSKLWLSLAMALCYCAARSQVSEEQSSGGSAASADTGVFSYFSASLANESAILKWGVHHVQPGSYFIVEKSADGNHFETLGAIASSLTRDTVFSLTDNAIGNGLAYYRIRGTGKDGNPTYSKTVHVALNLVSDFRFYPNPVDKLLIVRALHPLVIQVMDAYGVVWLSQEINAGMQIINVSTLQKGNYILKATDKKTNGTLSEQLIKN